MRRLHSPMPAVTPRVAIPSMDSPMLTPYDSQRCEDTDGSSFPLILASAMRIHEKLRAKSLDLEAENRRLQMELICRKQHMNLWDATPRPEQGPKSLTPVLDPIVSNGTKVKPANPNIASNGTKVKPANPTGENRQSDWKATQPIPNAIGKKSSSLTKLPASVEEPASPTSIGYERSTSRMSPGGTLRFSKHQKKFGGDQSEIARVTRLLSCDEFEFAIAAAIMLNTVVMCCECQYVGLGVGFDLKFPGRNVTASKVWMGAETAFHFLNWFFGILFFLEMVVKLVCFRIKYFYDSWDWDPKDMKDAVAHVFRSLQGWNMLDFLCVSAFLFDKLAASASTINPQMIRLLRLFRLFRIVRLVRFLETFDHLYVMTTAISGLTKVLAWAITLLSIMLLACNLFLVQILQVTYFHRVTISDLSLEQLERHHEMYAYFGTCTRCMLSMFEITLGNWPPVARLLSEEVSEWFTFVCLAHKLTIGFAVIGVINGVILQETFKVAQTDDIIMLRQKQKQTNILRNKMDSLFCTLDSEGDGKLNMLEFCSIGEDPEIKLWLASQDIETDDLKTLFALIDVDDSGFITTDELFARMPRIKGAARGIDVLTMRRELEKGGLDVKGKWTRAKDWQKAVSV